MSIDAWPLPWTPATVPHALLDIIRGCNVSCRACFNTRPAEVKPLAQVLADLDVLCSRRRLQSVSLVGGEVTLHPQLCEIVRLCRARGLGVELFTNAVLLDDALLGRLREAGASVIFAHIESTQRRPDLPAGATTADARRLWHACTERIAAHGMEAGLAITVSRSSLAEAREMIRFVLESPHAAFLLATLHRDVSAMRRFRGDLLTGLFGDPGCAATAGLEAPLSIADMHGLMREEFEAVPFACLGSNRDAADLRWLSYLVGVATSRRGGVVRHAFRASRLEAAFLQLHHRLSGRYPFHVRHSRARFRVQTLLNAVSGGGWWRTRAFLRSAWSPGAEVRAKRILFQSPAEIAADGGVVHCFTCPDATVREGRLVPACVVDRWEA